jgi:uncharacterized Ntn-hydrolase superfamily protein
MSLFTSPVTLSDGTGSRIFTYQLQEPGNIIAGRWNEPAALAAANSVLRVLQSTQKNGFKRHMLQSAETIALTDPGVSDPASADVVINITISHHPKHAVADVEKRVLLLKNAISIAGFTNAIMQGNI